METKRKCFILRHYSRDHRDKPRVQCNKVVTPKSRKMGLLHLFDIKDEIFKENFSKFRNLL